jgi:hypothetical protein
MSRPVGDNELIRGRRHSSSAFLVPVLLTQLGDTTVDTRHEVADLLSSAARYVPGNVASARRAILLFLFVSPCLIIILIGDWGVTLLCQKVFGQ